jgi:hypothetical protein
MCPKLQLLLTPVYDCRARLAVSGRLFVVRAIFRVRVFGGHICLGPSPRAVWALTLLTETL